jgi:dihydrofolate synthase/folylpolyglutamate synthase
MNQIANQKFDKLWIVFGVVKDKSPDDVLALLPKDAYYYFCQAKIPRAMDANELCKRAITIGLKGEAISDVKEAIAKAKSVAGPKDFVFVGGSTFVVAEIDNL